MTHKKPLNTQNHEFKRDLRDAEGVRIMNSTPCKVTLSLHGKAGPRAHHNLEFESDQMGVSNAAANSLRTHCHLPPVNTTSVHPHNSSLPEHKAGTLCSQVFPLMTSRGCSRGDLGGL